MEDFNTNAYQIVDNFTKTAHVISIPIVHACLDSVPLITIAIPTYKRPELLKEAIDSALNQDGFIDYNVIILDNDPERNCKTEKLISTYSDKRLSYYKNAENIGMFGNLNRCIQLAQTKYVALLHDDDILNSNYIETITKYLLRISDIGCICVPFNQIDSPYFSIKENLKTTGLKVQLKKWIFQNKLYRIPNEDNYFLHRNVFGPPTCGTIFNQEFCLLSGGWNEDYFPAADWFFMIYFNQKYKVYHIPDILASYRWESNTSLDPGVMFQFFQQSNTIVDSYKKRYRLFYHEIIRQVQNDYEKYGVKFNDSKIYNFSKRRMKLLTLIQRLLNLKYISFIK